MGKKESYAEMLRNPLWQKKRLEIMQRDDFTCQHCGSKERELQVHHRIYHKGSKPWEYEDKELITLCSQCHEAETDAKANHYEIFKEICDLAREIGLSEQFIDSILNNMLSAIAFISNKSDEYGFCGIEEETLKNVLFGTQILNDAKILFRSGINLSKEEETQVKSCCGDIYDIYEKEKKMNDCTITKSCNLPKCS